MQPVDSLEALAFGQQAAGERGLITYAVDAARGEFYIAKFELGDTGIKNIERTHLIKRREFELLMSSQQMIMGPGLEKNFSAASDRYPAAKDVGGIASEKKVNFIEASELEPVYLRKLDFVKAPPLRDIPPLS